MCHKKRSKSHPAAGGPGLPGSLRDNRVLIVRGDDGALGSCQQPAESCSQLLALLVGQHPSAQLTATSPPFPPPPLPAHLPLFSLHPLSCLIPSPPLLPLPSPSSLLKDIQAPGLALPPWTHLQKAWSVVLRVGTAPSLPPSCSPTGCFLQISDLRQFFSDVNK